MRQVDQRWRERIGDVFDVGPRPRPNIDAPVIPRPTTKEQLARALADEGWHVCLDGPTGAGKSSLALTYLTDKQAWRPHRMVQVLPGMTWVDLCRELDPDTSQRSTKSREVQLGLGALPDLKIRRTTTTVGSDAAQITEHDIAHALAEQNATLVIDDADQANDHLLRRIAAVCRLIPQSFRAKYAAVVVIGSTDTCHRLHKAMPSLQDRLIQVSLGGFAEKSTCRSFMAKSFEALGLSHPWSPGSHVAKDNQEWGNRLIWDATAGLPKSLNFLGRRIARRPSIDREVTFEDIRLEAVGMTQEHVREWAGEFPDFVSLLNSHPVAFAIVQFLAKNGITGTYDVAACRRDLVPGLAANSEFELALDLLSTNGFLVRTGRALDVMFVKNPTFANTLRVVSQDPDAYATVVTLPRTFRLPSEDDPSVNQADEDPGT